MRRTFALLISIFIGSVAVVAPLWISIQLSRKEALANESSIALYDAQDVLRRVEEMSLEIRSGTELINGAHNAPCSPQELVLMRRVDVSSSYIQAVARIVGNQMICTSLADQGRISLGPPSLITANAGEERLGIQLPFVDHPVDVFSRFGIAFILDPYLSIDIPTEGPDISITVFVPSSPNRTIFAAKGPPPPPEWFRPIPKGGKLTFSDKGHIVTEIASANIDIAVIVAEPESYVTNHVRQFAYVFIPLGLLCAAVLAWVVAHISRVCLSLPSVLRGAARRKEFFVLYQPIVELSTGRWVGAEALVRWKRSGKTVMPDYFIPIAEDSRVITLITACVIEIVTADLPEILKINPDFLVAINLSALDLQSMHIEDLLRSMLVQGNIQPANVKVEATERGFLQGKETRAVLAAIRSLGIEVAIDDFGTGFSSLSCLQTLGLDALKIDKSFVDTIGTDGATSQVVSHIIGMAHSLKLTMVAEGVETPDQAQFLIRGGVHFAQGWLFGKPMGFSQLCDECRKSRSNATGIPELEPKG